MVAWLPPNGRPCRNGHIAPRHPTRLTCQTCQRLKWRERRIAHYQRYIVREREKRREDEAMRRAAGTDWGARNRAAHAAMKSAWKKANRPRVVEQTLRRKTRLSLAMPGWLTAIHRAEIVAAYDVAAAASMQTGVRHEVDHIVPLNGRHVSGLHVPWNLRVIPATENNARPRIWQGAV